MSDCPDLPTTAEQAWEDYRELTREQLSHPDVWHLEKAAFLAGFDAACPTPSTEQIAEVLTTHAMIHPNLKDLRWTCAAPGCDWTASEAFSTDARRRDSYIAHVASVLARLYGEGTQPNPFGTDFPCCAPCTTHQIRNCTICLQTTPCT
jgi:hypothetical protein